MTVTRLTTIADVVRIWPFFRKGIQYEAKYLRYDYPIDTYRRIVFSLVKQHEHAIVLVAWNVDAEPIGFVLAHDITPIHAPKREFEVSMFYYEPGCKSALGVLQSRLDRHCRENGVCRYFLSTSSFCSTAERVFNNAWRGLSRSNTVFQRTL